MYVGIEAWMTIGGWPEYVQVVEGPEPPESFFIWFMLYYWFVFNNSHIPQRTRSCLLAINMLRVLACCS